MKKKNAAKRRWNSVVNTTSADQDENHQLAKAIEASKATARNELSYNESIKVALGLSKQASEEDEALKAAMQASLQSEQERIALLALGVKATATLVQATVSQQEIVMDHRNSTATLQNSSDPPSSPSVRTLKVIQGCDVRRLRVQWSSDASPDEIVPCLKDAVEKGFGLGAATPYVLKYSDDEGDLCTLVEETIFDFLELTNQTSMKLILDIGISASSATYSKPVEHNVVDDTFVEENGISIATPPESPRSYLSETIEGDYEASWDIIEHAFPSDALGSSS